jgi:predicted nucleotidyltransferase
MTTRTAIDPETLAAVQAFAERIRRDFPVKQVLLYGSRARGDHQSDSDVDVAVVLDGERQRREDVAVAFSTSLAQILLNTGMVLSAFPMWQDEWDDPELAFNPWLIRSIKREGVGV